MMNQSLRNLLDMGAIFFNEDTLKVEMMSREELAKLLPAEDVDYAMQVIEDIHTALHKGTFAQFEQAVKQAFQTSFKPIQKASEVAELTGAGKALPSERSSRINDVLLRKKAKETGVNLLLSDSEIVLSDARQIYVDTKLQHSSLGIF